MRHDSSGVDADATTTHDAGHVHYGWRWPDEDTYEGPKRFTSPFYFHDRASAERGRPAGAEVVEEPCICHDRPGLESTADKIRRARTLGATAVCPYCSSSGGKACRIHSAGSASSAPTPATEPSKYVVKVWYRAMRGDRLWCESSSAREVIRMSESGDRLERMSTIQYDTDWEPWRPDAEHAAVLRAEFTAQVRRD